MGYQNLKKSQIAGSVSVVDAAKVRLGGVPSIENMLQGQITGMNVIINSGDPGASAKIRIRGTSSILGNRAPLWVLDGIILTEDDMGEINMTDLNGDPINTSQSLSQPTPLAAADPTPIPMAGTTPVPMVTYMQFSRPLPAPSLCSEMAATFTSVSKPTGIPNSFSQTPTIS